MKKGRPRWPDPLERGQPVGKLFEADRETPFENRQIVAGCLAGAQEAAIGHDQRCRDIAGEMPFEQRRAASSSSNRAPRATAVE